MFNYCYNIICFSYGKCYIGNDDFVCVCDFGFFGKFCSEIYFCKVFFCVVFFVCKESYDGCMCECLFGLGGDNCDWIDYCLK